MMVCVGQRSFNSYLKHQPNNNKTQKKNGHCIQQQQQHQQSNASFAHLIFFLAKENFVF